VDLELLQRLTDAAGQPMEVEALAAVLGIGGAELMGRVNGLRDAGYVIERTHPHGSAALRLLRSPDRLYAHDVERRLTTEWLGRKVVSVDTCSSTNDLAKDLAREGAASGTLVLAESQSAGRGRAGRAWYSPSGTGIYASLIIRPEGPPPTAAVLQFTTGVAVAHAAMKRTGKPARLKWPNDLLFAGRKAAGLLVEAIDYGSSPILIIGIGLNVNQIDEDFPEDLRGIATSLRLVGGCPLDRLSVLGTLLSTLEEWYERMAKGDTESLAAAWRPLSSLIDQEVVITRGDTESRGTVADLDPVRGVLLKAPGGSETWIPAEHVTRIRPVVTAK
jgi:BirA family biotin operon repressor/biotin-[acetyl-CoA-carboxylase] ligase